MWELMGFIMEDPKELHSQISNIVMDGTLGNRKESGDDGDGVGDANRMCFGNVASEAAVVFGGWSYIPAVFTMECP